MTPSSLEWWQWLLCALGFIVVGFLLDWYLSDQERPFVLTAPGRREQIGKTLGGICAYIGASCALIGAYRLLQWIGSWFKR